MKTSELIEKNARALQSLFSLNPTPAHLPVVFSAIEGLADYTVQLAPETREHCESLVEKAQHYYGREAGDIDMSEHEAMMRSLRTCTVLIASASGSYRLRGD